jgi:hypothetical protein
VRAQSPFALAERYADDVNDVACALRCEARITDMQSADLRNGDHGARPLDGRVMGASFASAK